MTKWEYRVYNQSTIADQELNRLGSEGWELATVIPRAGQTSGRGFGGGGWTGDLSISLNNFSLIFKRSIKE